MDVYAMREWYLPEGRVIRVEADGIELWRTYSFDYVSLGDSIAAGHGINDSWESQYGYDSQYGSNGNQSTALVPGSYTDLLRASLVGIHGANYTRTKSFAKSGDTVEDLIKKLDHDVVRQAIEKAKLVTVCIGANDVLQPAMLHFGEYINGDMSQMISVIQSNLARLGDDSSAYSYRALLEKLYSINPSAKYVFTTIYNPFKYLYLEKSTADHDYKDGFLGPLMWSIPDFLGDVVANAIRAAFLKAPAVVNLFNKINELSAWAEQFVVALNAVIAEKVFSFGNPNFIIADSKAVFDPVPDRNVVAPKHYNDLVNVEFTRGYTVNDVNWGEFWANVDWNTILNNIDQAAAEIIDVIVNDVIIPDADPHPEWYGHSAIHRGIMDALGLSSLNRYHVSYMANGGTGEMATQDVIILEGKKVCVKLAYNGFVIDKDRHHFEGWNTKADGSGVSYMEGQEIEITGDIVLYAQWTDLYRVAVSHSVDSPFHTSADTGPMECYALWIDGVEQSDLGKFSNSERVYRLPYGTRIGVVAQVESGDARSYITYNGTKVAGNSSDSRWEFTLTGDTNIHFEWTYWLEFIFPQSYWNCYITTT